MATPSRRKSSSVSDRLFAEPYRFGFFQATRLLQGLVRKWRMRGKYNPVGRDVSADDESLKFSSLLSLQFASSEVAKIQKHKRIIKSNPQDIAEVTVSFMGLTGQSGVLPVYFTELQLQRIREKDTALHDFFDIFNHRAISFFYRAWEKYRLPFCYEQQQLHNSFGTDPISKALESLLGVSESTIQTQIPLNPEDMIFYAGLFATQRRSASGLAAALSEYMGVPIAISQFCGEWMPLSDDDRLYLPHQPFSGRNNCLGVDSVIGDQVYTVEGKFEVVIGPLTKKAFDTLMPNSERIKKLKHFTQMYVGCAQHFDLKYELQEEVVSDWLLGETLDNTAYLGWNTWLSTADKAGAQRQLRLAL